MLSNEQIKIGRKFKSRMSGNVLEITKIVKSNHDSCNKHDNVYVEAKELCTGKTGLTGKETFRRLLIDEI